MPWEIEESNEPSGLDGIWLSGLAGLKEVFLGFKDDLTEEEWADIYIIAAAPDLLAACEAVVEANRTGFECGVHSTEYRSELQDAVEKARKAVKRARATT